MGLTLHAGQDELYYDQNRQFHCVVAGVGYGKTIFGPWWHFRRVLENPKSAESIVCAPTFRLVKQRCMPDYVAHLRSLGFKEGKKKHFDVNWSDHVINVHLYRGNEQKIIFLSGESPESIVAYSVSHAWIDEAALCPEQVMKNLIKRLRCPKSLLRRQILCTSTPEGTNWFHDRFGPHNCRRIRETDFSIGKSALVLHGSSFDNPYLDQDYLDLLIEEFSWDEAYYQNYVLGQWVSLSKDRFYFAFKDRINIGAFPPMLDCKNLAISFDNNVGQMAWVALQQYADRWICVASNRANARTIEEAIQQIVDTFPPLQWRNHKIDVFGDATLYNRNLHNYLTAFDVIETQLKSNYPDLSLRAPRFNPAVEDRMFVTNRAFEKGRLIINKSCTKVIESARTAETDGKRGIRKKSKDKVTHLMEALDMALVNLEPRIIARERVGVNL